MPAFAGMTISFRLLAYRALELPKHRVAALNGRIERLLGGLFAGQRTLDFLRRDVAQRDNVAEPKAAGILGRLLVGQFQQRRLEIGLILVKAFRLGFFVGSLGDRQVAGGFVGLDLPVGV